VTSASRRPGRNQSRSASGGASRTSAPAAREPFFASRVVPGGDPIGTMLTLAEPLPLADTSHPPIAQWLAAVDETLLPALYGAVADELLNQNAAIAAARNRVRPAGLQYHVTALRGPPRRSRTS
jgi:hypothetical protein